MAKRTMSARSSAFASSAMSQRTLARSKPNFSSSQSTSRRWPEWICPPFRPEAPLAISFGLDQHHVGAGLGQMEGGRQTGEAAADDADVGAARAVERRVFAARRRLAAGRRTGAGKRTSHSRERRFQLDVHAYASDAKQRYSRSHGLITPMKVSYSVSLMAR